MTGPWGRWVSTSRSFSVILVSRLTSTRRRISAASNCSWAATRSEDWSGTAPASAAPAGTGAGSPRRSPGGTPAPFPGDGAVQNAVGKAGDGGHGGSSARGRRWPRTRCALLLGLGQESAMALKAAASSPDLVVAVFVVGDARPPPPGEAGGRRNTCSSGVHHLLDGEGADDQGDQEHRDGGDEESWKVCWRNSITEVASLATKRKPVGTLEETSSPVF